ncbi:hypothetical protein ACJMK2_031339 [Sinanodonta woodiana]|uniref:Uncharacterized protein n=1 Tax=Sinanodonta woodiana TaxID=1069815 RepID=A0ABD3WYH4_SINWO
MEFARFLCFLSVLALSLALPADTRAKDVQAQSSMLMENEDTRYVFPEDVNKYYWSKLPIPPSGYMWKYKLVPVLVDPRVPHIEYTLVEDQSSEINPQDLQEDVPENAEKSSVDKAIHRLKRSVRWETGISFEIPSESPKHSKWSLYGKAGYYNPAFEVGVGADIGGRFDKPPHASIGGYAMGAGSMPNLDPLATIILCMAVTLSYILL